MNRVQLVGRMRPLRDVAVALYWMLALLAADAATHPAMANIEKATVLMQRMATAQRQLQGYPRIMELWRANIPQFYCKPPKKPTRADDLNMLKQWEDEANRLNRRLRIWHAQLRRLASNQFVLNTIVAQTGNNPDSTEFWQPYQTAVQRARRALNDAKSEVMSRPERDCSPPREEQEPQTESPPPDPLAGAGLHVPVYREVPSVTVPEGPVCEDDYWEIVHRVSQARGDAAFNAWQAQVVVWSIVDAIARGKKPVSLLRQKETEARAESRRREQVYQDLDALFTKAKALERIDCTKVEPPQTGSEISVGVAGDIGVDIPTPVFLPVKMPEIPEGPLCKEDKQKIVNAAYIERNKALTNVGAARKHLNAIRNALALGDGNRAALIYARGQAVTAARERNKAFDAADAAYKKAEAIPVKPCGEDANNSETSMGTAAGATGVCGAGAAEQQATTQETRATTAQNSADSSWSISAGYKLGYDLKLEAKFNTDYWDDATDVTNDAVLDGDKKSESCLSGDQTSGTTTGGQSTIQVPTLNIPLGYNYLLWGNDLDKNWLNDRIGARFGTGMNYFDGYYQSNGTTFGSLQIPQAAGSETEAENFLSGLQNGGGFGHNYCRGMFGVESLQETPIAISVFSGEQLKGLSVSSLSGVIETVPGVTGVQGTPIGGATVSIRGMDPNPFSGRTPIWTGNDGLGPLLTTTNGLGQYGFDAAALDRVEVLRGPQGTLYGQSSMGGVVNVVTKSDPPANCQVLAGHDWSSATQPLSGDLIQDAINGANNLDRIPFLSDLPGVGDLFNRLRNDTDPEYTFLIRPFTIIPEENE